jgi:hypothetical protein
MKSRMKASMLACVLAGWARGVVAQDDCSEQINTIVKIGDVQAALNCVQGRVAAETRARQEAEKNLKQLPQQVADQLQLEATNGIWKQIPESADADACFLSSVRLPPQGLCQITYQGTLEHWSYNVSDRGGAGFLCTATCVWMDVRRKPEAAPAEQR